MQLIYERVQETLSLFCEQIPSIEMIAAWDCHIDDELHIFVVDNMKLSWAQGIEVIDAAFTIAKTPREDIDG